MTVNYIAKSEIECSNCHWAWSEKEIYFQIEERYYICKKYPYKTLKLKFNEVQDGN